MTSLPFFAAVIFLFLTAVTVAEIETLTISDDSRPVVLIGKFGFTQTGHITVSVSSVSSSPSPDSSSGLGFFLLTEESLQQVLLEIQRNPRFCILESHHILHLFTFRNQSHFDLSYSITSPSEYSLFFANCVPEARVSMKIQTEMYNLDPNGSKIFLPPGSTQLPGLYFIVSLCYFLFFCLWVYFCYNNKQIVQRIHLLMTALLVMKALNLICAAEVQHYVKVTGTAHGWNILFYIFRFTEVVLLFTVIVLIATGWSFLKPKVQEKKKKLLMIVIPLQVLANTASTVIGETGPFVEYWVIWNQIFLLADVICCCAIILAMVWSMCCSLRKTSKTDAKASINLAKLSLFRKFYILVIAYLLFTRIVVFALKVLATYEYQWVSNAAEEIAGLAFYILMFSMFRPMERNEYFGVDEEGEEAAQPALKK